MALLGVCFSVLLWCFISRWLVAGSTFNPNCYANRREENFTVVNAPELLTINTYLPTQTQILSFETIAKPLSGCGLDLYLKGDFYLYNAILDLVKIECITNTEGYSEGQVIKIKTGSQYQGSKHPDVPMQWWHESVTVILVKITEVNAHQVGLYLCSAHQITLSNDETLRMNITISVNGCPEGYWGGDCKSQCRCQNGARCNSWDGSCDCSKFWKGEFCETEFPHVEMVDRNVYYGGNTTLECMPYFLRGKGKNIRWRFNGTYLTERDNIRIGVVTRFWSISIYSITDANIGMYTCEVTYGEQIYNASSFIDVTGCLPGWFGQNCSRTCGCKNNGTCGRLEGCQCSDQFTGSQCQLMKCADGVGRDNCHQASGKPVNTLGYGLGGGISVLILIIIAVAIFIFKSWHKVTVHDQSTLDTNYFRSKDVTDLVKHKDQLVSDDVGVLWTHWALDESLLYVGKQLDEGNFSTVYEGHVVQGHNFYNVAIKMLKDEKETTAYDNFKGEFLILAHVCPHPNIVQLVGLCSKSVFNQAVSCIILEHMSMGSLYKFLHSNRKPALCDAVLTPDKCSQIVLGVLRGMVKLEELRYVHRDLATRNVLLTDNMVAKISDFGLARDAYSTGNYQTGQGKSKKLPWKWMAFESLKDNVYTSKSDIWSFGVLLWEIATLGASPYPGVSNEGLLAYLEKGNRLECPVTCSQVWYAAMKVCWAEDAEDRPAFIELVPFFTDLFNERENQSPFLRKMDINTDCP